MTINQVTKDKIMDLCQKNNISVPGFCSTDEEVTVEDIVAVCCRLGISVRDFFNSAEFQS